MATDLGERQAQILRAIVREYIRSGEPVGSQHLVERARIGVSSATVRNEMSRLEEMGYLAQPHTSAGRIPTDRAFRFLVDELRPRPLAEEKRRAIASELHEGEPASMDDILHRASDVVARFTRHAAAVLARRGRPSTVRRVELFSMGARMATLILIAENGRVEQRIIPLPDEVSAADVDVIGEHLARDLHGVGFDAAAKSLDDLARTATTAENDVIAAVRAAVIALLDTGEQIVVGGAANLAVEQDFERETLQRVYETLEHEQVLMKLLAGALDTPLSVRIGSEMPGTDLQSCALVVANFGGEDASRGSVGVIGPIRMDYERVIATANAVARLLESTLGSTGGPQ